MSNLQWIETINLNTGNKYEIVCHEFYGILSYFEALDFSGMIFGIKFDEQTYKVSCYKGKKKDFGAKISTTGKTIFEALKELESCLEIESFMWRSPFSSSSPYKWED